MASQYVELDRALHPSDFWHLRQPYKGVPFQFTLQVVDYSILAFHHEK